MSDGDRPLGCMPDDDDDKNMRTYAESINGMCRLIFFSTVQSEYIAGHSLNQIQRRTT